MSNLGTYLEYFARKGLVEEGEERVIGENSSGAWEIKTAFDGYGDDGENTKLESYAMYIHKDAANPDFTEFPEHESAGFSIVHRPDQEACIFFWYNVEEDSIEFTDYEYSISETSLSLEQVEGILKTLYENYLEIDSGNIVSTPSNPWPFG